MAKFNMKSYLENVKNYLHLSANNSSSPNEDRKISSNDTGNTTNLSTGPAHAIQRKPNSKITEEDVIACYEKLLGRKPENVEVVKIKLDNCRSFKELITDFVGSEEYQSACKVSLEDIAACYRLLLGRDPDNSDLIKASYNKGGGFLPVLKEIIEGEQFQAQQKSVVELYAKNYSLTPGKIETDPNFDVLHLLFSRIKKQWSGLGDTEPYWSVLTSDEFKRENIDKNIQEFYQSGIEATSGLKFFFIRNGLPLPSGSCVELGCGVGRVTAPLSRLFNTVQGLDISPGNLKIASAYLKSQSITNAELSHIQSLESFDSLAQFDFFYSVIVLQHNPPPVQKIILDKIFSKIKIGGGCLFQVQTEKPNYGFNSRDYLKSTPEKLEMHVLPMNVIFELLRKHKIPLREVRPDNWTGNYGSYTFFAYGKEG